ncbi:MAG: hypothetical protein QNJ62_08860, partial [Methyloceanibacter sp.]|nr:hypothetical protein [Methyloceanibacter sp.]
MTQSVRCGACASANQGSGTNGKVNTGGRSGLLAPREIRCSLGRRRALLLGTALASLAVFAPALAPPPAAAQATCVLDDPFGTSLNISQDGQLIARSGVADLICVNPVDRVHDADPVIHLSTTGYAIDLHNTGSLTAKADAGIYARTSGLGGSIKIWNSGDIAALEATEDFSGIYAIAAEGLLGNANVLIENSGRIMISNAVAPSDRFVGIDARARGGDITIANSGVVEVTTRGFAFGLYGKLERAGDALDITNTGSVAANGESSSFGIAAVAAENGQTFRVTNEATVSALSQTSRAVGILATTLSSGTDASFHIENKGQLTAECTNCPAYGVRVSPIKANSDVSMVNSGLIMAASQSDHTFGIDVISTGGGTNIDIENSGDIEASTFGGVAHGIRVRADGGNTYASINNSGLISAISQDRSAYGIGAKGYATGQRFGVHNTGDIQVSTSGGDAQGILLVAGGANSGLTTINNGVIGVNSRSGTALGIDATGTKNDVVIDILNTGNITVHSDAARVHGIRAISFGSNSVIGIRNTGIISVETASADHESFGIRAAALGSSSPIFIANTGTIVTTGKNSIGVYASSADAGGVAITNIGSISASSYRAIDVKGRSAAHIFNSGRITGFVNLTEQNDLFENRSGGVFETKNTTH